MSLAAALVAATSPLIALPPLCSSVLQELLGFRSSATHVRHTYCIVRANISAKSDMSRRKQNKSVSFDDNNEYFSASSYPTTSESNRSDSHERIEKVYCVENSVELDPLYVYGLPQDDDASDVSFVIDENDHLFRVSDGQWDAFAEVPPAYDANLAFEKTEAFPQYMEGDMVFSERVDDEISDYGSAEWDSDQSVVDDETIDDAFQADRLSTGALFGDRPWRSITPLQAVTEIMDAVNVG